MINSSRQSINLLIDQIFTTHRNDSDYLSRMNDRFTQIRDKQHDQLLYSSNTRTEEIKKINQSIKHLIDSIE